MPEDISMLLANKAQASQANVEYKEWVNCNADSVLDHATTAHDTDTGSKRPADQYDIDWYPRDSREMQCREKRCDDEWEECVSNNTHRLCKRSIPR